MSDYSSSFEFMRSTIGGVKSASGEMLTHCPDCSKKKLYWNEKKKGNPFQCKACGKSGNAATLGYLAKRKNQKNLTDLEKCVNRYHYFGGKKHRLSDPVITSFKLSIGIYKNSRYEDYQSLTLKTPNGKPVKRLVSDKWIALKGEDMPDDLWLNIQNIKEEDKTLYVVAGEWDMFSFWENCSLHAISPVYGETARSWTNKKKHLQIFNNKNVVIIYDNDEAGKKGSKSLAIAIKKHGQALSIKTPNVEQLGLKEGGDLDDFFSSGGKSEELFKLIEESESLVVQPNAQPVENDLFSNLKKRKNPCPKNPDSMLDEFNLDTLWRIGGYPKATKNKLLINLANSEGYGNKNLKERLSIYNDELATLTSLAVENSIQDLIQKRHIVNKESFPKQSDKTSYYYDHGVYHLLNNDTIRVFAETILNEVFSHDSIFQMSKIRKEIKDRLSVYLLTLPEKQFDCDLNFINLKNGLYSLKEKCLSKHTPSLRTTFQLAIDYTADTNCPSFKSAIDLWFSTQVDKNEFLKILYYCLSGNRSKHKAIIFFGEGGNGKSVTSRLLASIMGSDRVSALSLEDLNDTHMTASLEDSWLNLADEIGKSSKIKDDIFKKITGESFIQVNPKYRQPFKLISKALWVISTNHIPASNDNTEGFYRRFKFVKFNRIAEESRKDYFYERCLAPELSQIMSYILEEGRRLWDSHGGFNETRDDKYVQRQMETKNSVSGYWMNQLESYLASVQKGDAYPQEERPFQTCDGGKYEGMRYIDYKSHHQLYIKYCEIINQRPTTQPNFKGDTLNYFNRWFLKQQEKKLLTSFELRDESLYLPVSSYSLEKKNKRVIIVITESKAADMKEGTQQKIDPSKTKKTEIPSELKYLQEISDQIEKQERNSSKVKPTQTRKNNQEKSPDVNKSSLFKK